MKTVRVTWVGASGLEWEKSYTDMDMLTLRINNLLMNCIPFTVDYL